MGKSVALILTKTPFVDYSGQEALDMAMVMGTFEIASALFFIDQSVTQFKAIKPELVGTKNFVKGFSALPFYDIEDLFVCDQSLKRFHVAGESLPSQLTILSNGALKNKLATYDLVIRF